jgi:hypothetical protein
MGDAKRRKQLDPNYGKPRATSPQSSLPKSGSNITEETIKMAGAVQPKDSALPPAIVWGIQFQDVHDYQQLFISSLHFLNRDLNPYKYLFTTEQFDRVLQLLVDQKVLVFRNGGYYHHPAVQEEIDKYNTR